MQRNQIIMQTHQYWRHMGISHVKWMCMLCLLQFMYLKQKLAQTYHLRNSTNTQTKGDKYVICISFTVQICQFAVQINGSSTVMMGFKNPSHQCCRCAVHIYFTSQSTLLHELHVFLTVHHELTIY